ncbi:hypothetical protein [Nocardioides speluncae]|uniref:hypothetical protein n=1 Tax=Nocardioides speluncae TaxID=2670337 RepID=UPI000D685CC9|nr:hypothetical protein [Nocardioides speluncae]
MVDYNPFEVLTKSQRAALGLASEAWTRLYDATVTGVTQPEEALRQVGALVTAVGDLASATAQPLQDFLTRQRELAESMATLANAHAELAQVAATLAERHAATVDALEKLSAPVLGLVIKERPEDDPAVG